MLYNHILIIENWLINTKREKHKKFIIYPRFRKKPKIESGFQKKLFFDTKTPYIPHLTQIC